MPELDGLRACAFLAVAWSHWMPHHQFGLPWGSGVQLFFVLSGFLITGILLESRKQCETPGGPGKGEALRVFYARRCLRIFPLFYLVLAGALLLNIAPIRETWGWHAAYASNFLFAVHRDAVYGNPFLHFWSLAVEEQFYMVWPGLVLFLAPRTLKKAIIGLIVAAPLFRIAMAVAFPEWHRVNYLPLSCVDSLGVGALLALISARPELHAAGVESVANRLAVWGLAGGFGTVMAILLYQRTPRLESIGHTCLVLFFGWVVFRASRGFGGIEGKILGWEPLRYLGKISYGLYIFHHFFTYVTFQSFFARLGVPPEWAGSELVLLLPRAACTLAAAVVSWHFFEAPLNGLKNRFVLPVAQDPSKQAAASRVEKIKAAAV